MTLARADVLLLFAVLTAIVLALSGVADRSGTLPADAVAVVNGRAIGRAELAAAADAAARQLERTPDAGERAAILERAIEEELLVAQGIALDLPRKNTRLRSLIVQDVIGQAVADSAAQPVGEQELRAFHEAEIAFFRRPAAFRVWRFACRDAAHARELQAVLGAGGEVPPALAATRSALPPDAWLSEAKLGDYLGSGTAERVAALQPGRTVLNETPDGVSVLLLRAAQPARDPPFAEIRDAVEAEFRRRRDEAALRAYVERLRAAADVRIAGEDA